MSTDRHNEDQVLEALAENQIKQLAEEYRNTPDTELNTGGLDRWFESYMEERNETRSTGPARPSKLLYRVAAGLLLFFVAGSAFAFNTEALRVSMFNIFTDSKQEYTRLQFGEDTDLLHEVAAGWEEAYYLTQVPEGYKLVEANEVNGVRRMLYSFRMDSLVFSQGGDMSGLVTLSESEPVEVLGYDAYISENGQELSVTWQDHKGTYLSLSSAELDWETLVEAARSIRSVEDLEN